VEGSKKLNDEPIKIILDVTMKALPELENIDYRAEVIGLEYLRSQPIKGSVLFKRNGAFKRTYSNDIEKITHLKKDLQDKTLEIELNREGLYDYLPEELFHFEPHMAQDKRSNFTEKHSKIKEQEMQAREFFLPLENEFSSMLLTLEEKESQIFDLSNYNELIKFFFERETALEALTDLQKAKLSYFFPLAYKFKGNVTFVGFFLSSLLNYTVECKLINKQERFFNTLNKGLSEMHLGVDTICGDSFSKHVSTCIITFTNLPRKHAEYFLIDGHIKKLVDYVHYIFLPHSSDYEIKLEFKKEDTFLNSYSDEYQENSTYLGFNSIL
jgi:hypothetical protein